MLRLLNRFEEIFSVSLLIAMSVVIILQVIFRYFISFSLDWAEELGRYLFIASVYVGTSYAQQRDKHLAVTILRTSGGAWCARWLPVVASLVSVLFCAFMTFWGIQMVLFVVETNQVAPAMQFPMWIAYAVVPLGMGCMTLRSAVTFFNEISKSSTGVASKERN